MAQVSAAIESLANLASRLLWATDMNIAGLERLANSIAVGSRSVEGRAAMLAALDDELARLRSRFGEIQ